MHTQDKPAVAEFVRGRSHEHLRLFVECKCRDGSTQISSGTGGRPGVGHVRPPRATRPRADAPSGRAAICQYRPARGKAPLRALLHIPA